MARRCVYICKALDEDNRSVAVQVRWVAALAAHPDIEHITVLSRYVGRVTLPPNVTARELGRGRLRGLRMWRHVLAARRQGRLDFVFVCQGGPWPLFLLPLKWVMRFGLYQWKAHPTMSRGMRFCARWCDDLVFTATPSSFPLGIDTVRVVGHGIDTEAFRPIDHVPTRDLLAIGRVAPGKRLEVAIRATHLASKRAGRPVTLDIVGPTGSQDRAYRDELRALADELGMGDDVRIAGSVPYHEVPQLIGEHRATLNFTDTAFDKTAGESMACGVPVLTTNPCAVEVLPPELLPVLTAGPDDLPAQAALIASIVTEDEDTRRAMGAELRAAALRDHRLESLFDKIMQEITRHRAGRTGPAATDAGQLTPSP